MQSAIRNSQFNEKRLRLRVPASPRQGGWVTAAATVFFLLQCSGGEPALRYNIVLITIDTLRADHVGAYGDAAAKTPALDSVARDGVRFETAITAAPLTLPSHATILTGLLPPQHGLRNNGAGKLREDTSTLATTLSAAGYRTGAFVGAFVLDRRFGLNHGFEEYDDDIPAARSESARLEAERPADMVTDRAIAWMRKPDARPLFAWIHLYDPHAPYAPPDPFGAAFPNDRYRGEIAWVDSQVKRILEELDRQQISRNTIVVITGDHGEALEEHGEGTHGLLLYEPTLRVPLMIRAPGLLEPAVIRRPVGLVHLRSTLTALLDLEKPGQQDLLRGKSEAVYSETHYPVLFGWSSLSATRDETWKLIQSTRPELYNLALDPGETRNLYGQERRAMRKLSEAIAAVQRDSKQAAPAPLDEETRRKLASLGYVAPSGDSGGEPGANPVEKVSLFRRFEQAIGDLYGGQPQRAIAELEALATLDKNNPVFLSSLARAHRQHGKVGRAIELYREAVALRPEDPEGWHNLAAAFQESGDQRRAGEAIREAIRRDPSRPEAHNVLGITYASEGRFDEALREFSRASQLDPRNARAENNTGNVYRSLQKFDEAAAAYQRATERDPSYPDPWNGLGTVEIERSQPKRAVQFFERALSLSPAAHEARLNRAVALQLGGDLDGALAAYRDFVRAVEGNPAFAEQRRGAEQMIRRISSRRAG